MTWLGGSGDVWTTAETSTTCANVQCEKSFMRVSVEFDRPFYGMIFSKGYYSDQSCVHVQPGTGRLQAQFDIYLNSCGMTSTASNANYGQPTPSGTFIENTVIIQYDPLVQEVWDAARKLRCTWYDYYEKSVTFRPFQVDMLNAVTANFLGDNLQCWMQIQVGKGPWASEVSGIVKIGQTMTMVLAIKDDENKFDMMVRNCVAHDGKRAPIQLVDERGCVTRPKIMGRFQKVKNFGSSASVVSYAYFQAFKFPDSMNVHFQCVIQVCRYNCPEPQCDGGSGVYQGAPSNRVNNVVGLPDPRSPTKQALSSEAIPVASPQTAQSKSGDGVPGDVAGGNPLPVPVSVPIQPVLVNLPGNSYSQVNRQGSSLDSAGRPRSLDHEDLDEDVEEESRVRRSAVLHVYRRAAQEMTDVSTARVIQVVAPGDVAFNLNSANETVVISEMLDDASNICMSATGFAAGLVMLLLVLTIACLVACFLYTRVRTFNAKGGVTTFVQGFDNPEFVKVAGGN
ncbi:Cuticlin-1-like 1 [Homarus americanus]|uniref:Cuticlin-1-like 1 n=1 Tax=Homarus americanus TaxID=6706 RepID=A0A8J5TII0_HOMAM|nr:Cuticlin-1-like 1 [Homarus americanus]